MFSHKNALFSYAILAFIALYASVYFFFFKALDTRFSSFDSSPVLDSSKVSAGYTLLSPYNRITNADANYKGKVYLLDLLGRVVHSWNTEKQALYSILKPDGKLLSVMEAPRYSQFFPPGGNTGTIQDLDWDSRMVWKYENEAMHHDIVPLPSGNIVVALWEKTPLEISSQIQGGVPGTEMPGGLIWSDNVVEVNRSGEIVWSWHSYEHLDPSVDVIDPSLSRNGWTYINGISYTDKNPIDATPAFLLSYRSLGVVMFVRKSDGEIIWRSPKGMLNTQHDPTILPNGNILVFDNGFTRIPTSSNPFSSYGSRVVEIDPRTNKIVWQFSGGENVIDKVRFFAPIVGGAQRLSNGNTLITDGPKGHIFEVTKDGEVVWDLINPYTTKQTGQFPNNFLFKVKRYENDQIQFPLGIKQAFNSVEFSIYNLLRVVYP